MGSYLKSKLSGPPRRKIRVNSETFDNDPLAWLRPQERHHRGEFSMAAVQSYQYIEDHSQVDVGEDALFVAVNDGHKCDAAPLYIRTHALEALLKHIKSNADDVWGDNNGAEDLLREVFSETEAGFMEFARIGYEENGQLDMSVVSSGCLISIIWKGKIYLANVGGSCAIIVSHNEDHSIERLHVKQLVKDHSCENLDIQNELAGKYAYDADGICLSRFGSMRVKGLSEVSRCIGNAYMKRTSFTRSSTFQAPPGESVPLPFIEPLLSAVPDIHTRVLQDTDSFIIYGSSGFWKLLTNEQAAKIVSNNPREGIAKRLTFYAIEAATKQWGKRYSDIRLLPKGSTPSGWPSVSTELSRSVYHDDITVIVMYLDMNMNEDLEVKSRCYRSYSEFNLQSDFSKLDVGTW